MYLEAVPNAVNSALPSWYINLYGLSRVKAKNIAGRIIQPWRKSPLDNYIIKAKTSMAILSPCRKI